MTLRTELLASTLIQVSLVALLGGFLFYSSRQAADASVNETQATAIVDAVSQIRFSTFENLLHHDQRSYEQWHTKHNELATLLQPSGSQNADEHAIFADILQLSHEVEPIFLRLTASYNQTGQAELQERLATQLLVKQQTQISDSLRLASLAHTQALATKQQADILVVAVILVMLCIAVVNFFFITRTVASSLGLLQKGADAIASGMFDFRLKPRNKKDEFGRVALAFNTMASNLEQLDKVKSDFILLASHQLRTPLTAVKWYSKALTSFKGMPQERRRHYVEQVYASNERMIELVDKLLDASKIGVGRLTPQPEPVQMTLILEQALKDVSAQINDNHIIIDKIVDDTPITATLDPTWVRVIFQNLLSNAVRYSRPGQHVAIKLTREPDSVLITVADTGYGIPIGQQNKIFTKLFRADNARKAMGDGSGLGLYITKAMVEKTGGTVWFESTENVGTTFYVRLPLAALKTKQKE